ncbi:MAG: CapA family protein, partial [Candidatus Limnocylindrales bacterium]
TDAAEVAEILAGRSKRFEALELVEDEADAILDALDLGRPTDQTRLMLAADAAALTADLARHRTRLAFLRADAITPAVRALDWADVSLFGVDRVRTSVGWTLAATLPQASSDTSFDPTATWTLVAGGDIMLEGGVAQTLKVRGRGADFPFDGGRAEITGHICCSAFGWEIPQTRRTGGQGQMRRLIEGADLAIANFENPAPEAFRYHTSGTLFSADPELIEGLATAGFDWVGLANNHIRDAGGNGIIDTIKNLDRYGIASSGAGDNLGAARTPAILDAAGTKVALLAYDTIRRSYTAGPETPGSARLTAKAVRADIRKARRAGADVIIVFPHWGVEYDKRPFDGQRRLAQAAVDAGADLVIGNHAHWAGAMEVYEGKPVWYALGNFVFDQTWSEPTMEGLTLELTFHGADLVQARMRPHIILDKAQPNFLDPAADGRVVMNQVWTGSDALDLLPW